MFSHAFRLKTYVKIGRINWTNLLHAPVVELADTLDLGSSAGAWGFKSLQAHQINGLMTRPIRI